MAAPSRPAWSPRILSCHPPRLLHANPACGKGAFPAGASRGSIRKTGTHEGRLLNILSGDLSVPETPASVVSVVPMIGRAGRTRPLPAKPLRESEAWLLGGEPAWEAGEGQRGSRERGGMLWCCWSSAASLQHTAVILWSPGTSCCHSGRLHCAVMQLLSCTF